MRRRMLAAALVVVVAFVLYAPSIHDYFTQDDFGVVALFSERSLAYLPRWFVSPWTEDIWGYVPDEIRPFPAASYVMTAWFGAAAPEPNHILNIALHAANGLLVVAIAEAAAGLSLPSAAFAGVVFVLLPIQAESVAWVTGRVDSLPTLFYFGSFLLYVRSVWRKPDAASAGDARLKPYTTSDGGVGGDGSGRRQAAYWTSVALFFAALFSKQNTITMVPALMLFDWLVARRPIELSWRWLRRYVPYVVLTLGFLALRYVVFHEVARESILNAQRVREFLSDSSRHLVRLVVGGPGLRHWMWRDTVWIALPAAVIAMRSRLWRPAIYFAVVWIVLGVAPILMAGYYSPRHMYLASLGWALTLALALEALGELNGQRLTRVVAAVAAAAVAVAYAIQLHGVVAEWGRSAAISHAAVRQIEQEAASDPAGTLILAGVPRSSWAFSVPYSVRPPFTPTDLTKRVSLISDSSDHCCNAILWEEYTRARLRDWHARADRPPVVALFWNPQTERMTRVSDVEDPQLRTLAGLLVETRDREALDALLRGLLADYVALR